MDTYDWMAQLVDGLSDENIKEIVSQGTAVNEVLYFALMYHSKTISNETISLILLKAYDQIIDDNVFTDFIFNALKVPKIYNVAKTLPCYWSVLQEFACA